MKFTIIYNPKAGRGHRGLRLKHVVDGLRSSGAGVDLYETKGPADATQAAARHVPHPSHMVVAAGGDGTINEVVNGLMQSGGGRFGIIPMGTANILAHEIGLPLDPQSIIQTLLEGNKKPLALGHITHSADNTTITTSRYFCLMVGAGFDAHVVKNLNLELKRKIGKLAYGLASLQEIIRNTVPIYQIIADGKTYAAGSVIVTNIKHYAGPYLLAPGADFTDPSLELCLFQPSGRYAALRFGAALLSNRLTKQKDLIRIKCSDVQLSTTSSLDEPTQMDGELFGHLPCSIRAIASPIKIQIP